MGNGDCRLLQDREEIKELLFLCARATDLGDETLRRRVFHPDASDEHAGMFSGHSVEELIAKMTELRKAFNVMHHVISNISIKLDGDVADSECYVVATQGFLKNGEQYHWLAGGRYVDRMERRNREWRIARRVAHIDWSRIVKIESALPTPF